MTGWKMEIETDWGTFRVSDSFDSDNEIDVGIERAYKLRHLIFHVNEQRKAINSTFTRTGG